MAQRPLNLNFERSSVAAAERPWGWSHGFSPFASGPAATFTLDSVVRRSGKRSLRIALGDSAPSAPQTIMLQIPSAFAAGRKVSLTAWLRSAPGSGRAFITLEAWAPGAVTAADTAELANTANTEWARRDLSISVGKDAHSVVLTVGLTKAGSAWFDDLTLSVDGSSVSELATGTDASAAEVRWLTAHSTPLRDVRPPSSAPADDSDLDLFRKIVGDARVVALGESTHGTREFFLAKHRLLEYLVRRLGFSVFAIEANQVAVQTTNRYVLGGPGTAREAIRVMFAVWNTEEMEALVEWMRGYNASHPARPIRFVGYDMQDHRRPADTLRAFLERREPSLIASFDHLLGEYRAQRSWSTPQIADTTRSRWRVNAERLWQDVGARRTAWLTDSRTDADSANVEWAVQSANLLRQAALGNETLNVPDRDSLMAANLGWVLQVLAPGERAVVWAHDIHVSAGGDAKLSFYNGATMGAQLRRMFGDAYRRFSLVTYEGSYSATRGLTDYTMIKAAALPAPSGSLEKALHRVVRPANTVGLIVDLRSSRGNADARWLERPQRLRHVGYAAYDFAFDLEAVFPLEFDGVVFVDRTSASRIIR
jgi:erythromycin esterase